MIGIICALHSEAKPIIKHFKLKKDFKFSSFDLFYNNNIVLVISGIGMIRSASAVSFLFAKFKQDISLIINIGISGSTTDQSKISTPFIINKITNDATYKSFYPDMIIKSPFDENALRTFTKPITGIIDLSTYNYPEPLVDMEAAGFFEASSIFLNIHQIFTLKIISDYIWESNLPKNNDISDLIGLNIEKIQQFIDILFEFSDYSTKNLSKYELETIEQLSLNHKFTISMQNKLKKLLINYKNNNKNNNSIFNIINDYLSYSSKSKTDGKKVLDAIQQKITQQLF